MSTIIDYTPAPQIGRAGECYTMRAVSGATYHLGIAPDGAYCIRRPDLDGAEPKFSLQPDARCARLMIGRYPIDTDDLPVVRRVIASMRADGCWDMAAAERWLAARVFS